MAIAFRCPTCEKAFKVSDAQAGKKGKCPSCGGVVRIPGAASPPRSKPQPPPAPDLDVYGLGDASEAVAPAVADDDPPSGAEGLSVGTRLASAMVVESSPSRLVLASDPARIVWFLACGVAALIGGLVWQHLLDARAAQTDGPWHVPRWMVVLPFALVGFGVGSFCLLGLLGATAAFDGRSRSFSVRRLYLFDQGWSGDELGGVLFRVARPSSEDEHDKGHYQSADAIVFDRAGRGVALLDRVSTNKPKALVPLAKACVRAGRLLKIPVHVEEVGPPIRPEMRRAVATILKDGRRARPATKVRPPLVSAYRAMTLVSSVVMLGYGGWWWSAHRPDFPGLPRRPAVAAPIPAAAAPAGTAPETLRVIDQWAERLRSSDPWERQSTAFHLANAPVAPERRGEVRELLRNMAASNVEADRERALVALGRWGEDAEFPILTAALDEPSRAVREAAAEGLVKSGRPEAAELLAARFADPTRREEMARHLRRLGPLAEGPVAKYLEDRDDAAKLLAASIMQDVATRDSVAALQAAWAKLPALAMRPSDPFGPEGQLYRRLEELHATFRGAVSNAGTRPGAAERAATSSGRAG